MLLGFFFFPPHGEVSRSWLLAFPFPQEISCSLGKHPQVPCSSPGRKRCPKHTQLFRSFPSFLDSPFGVRLKSNSSLGK